MVQDFTPPRPTDRSMRPYVRSINHILKPDQIGNIDLDLTDLGDVDGTPEHGDTFIYNSVTNLFEFGGVAGPSWVDLFTVTDDATDTFLLTHLPIDKSWNVGMGWFWDEDNEFSIVGRVLTVLDPADTFRGIADNGPRTLRVQYDYLSTVPAPATFPQTAWGGEQTTFSPTMTFDDPPVAGSSVIVVYRSKFGGPISAIDGLGATWAAISTSGDLAVWLGVGCNGTDDLVTLASDHTFWTGMVEVTTPLTATGADVVTNTNANLADLTADAAGVCVSVNRAGSGLENTPAAALWTQIGNGTGGGATLRSLIVAAAAGDPLDVHTNGVDDWDRAILAMVNYA